MFVDKLYALSGLACVREASYTNELTFSTNFLHSLFNTLTQQKLSLLTYYNTCVNYMYGIYSFINPSVLIPFSAFRNYLIHSLLHRFTIHVPVYPVLILLSATLYTNR